MRAAIKVAAVWAVVLLATHVAVVTHYSHGHVVIIGGFDLGVAATWLLVRDRTPSPHLAHLSARSRTALSAARTLGLAGMSRAPFLFFLYTLAPVESFYSYRAYWGRAGLKLSDEQYWQMATSYLSLSAATVGAVAFAAFALVRRETNRVRAGGPREPLRRALFVSLVTVGIALWQVAVHLPDSDEVTDRLSLAILLVPELSILSVDIVAMGAIIACGVAISVLIAASLAIGSDRPPSSMGRAASEDDGIAALDLEREDDQLFVGDGIGRMQLPAT